jgi:hypothetical protein
MLKVVSQHHQKKRKRQIDYSLKRRHEYFEDTVSPDQAGEKQDETPEHPSAFLGSRRVVLGVVAW